MGLVIPKYSLGVYGNIRPGKNKRPVQSCRIPIITKMLFSPGACVKVAWNRREENGEGRIFENY
jgi:hypothetical protein